MVYTPFLQNILALLVGNAIVGFWEEYQAGNAIAKETAHQLGLGENILNANLFAETDNPRTE